MSWNKNSAKVIGITAAAAMALSLAPATAFTAYAAPSNGSSVSEQAASDDTAFKNGRIADVTVDGQPQTVKDNSISVEYTGKNIIVLPSAVTLQNGDVLGLARYNVNRNTSHQDENNTFRGSDGNIYQLTGPAIKDVNTYALVLAKQGSPSVRINLSVKVTPTDLSGVKVYNKATNDLNDSTFTYNTENQEPQIGFQKNGVALVKNHDYTVDFYKDAGHTHAGRLTSSSNPTLDQALKNAGTIYAEVYGIGNYDKGNETAPHLSNPVAVTITINPLDLSHAITTSNDFTVFSASHEPSDIGKPSLRYITVDGIKGSDLVHDAQLTLNASKSPNPEFVTKGAYTYTLSPKIGTDGKADPNVINSKDLIFNLVDHTVDSDTFGYGNKWDRHDEWAGPKPIDLDQDNHAKFTPDDVLVNPSLDTSKFQKDWYSVNIERENPDGSWSASSVDELNSLVGEYHVIISVDPTKTNFELGGSLTRAYRVYRSQRANVYVTVDGQPLYGNDIAGDHALNNIYYNGKAKDLTVKVVSNKDDKNLVEGKEYTYSVLKRQPDGTFAKIANNQVIDAGTYRVRVDPYKTSISNNYVILGNVSSTDPTYRENRNSQTFTVKPMEVKVSYANKLAYPTDPIAFAYQDGKDVVPELQFEDVNDNNKVVDVPSSAYTLSYTKKINDSSWQQVSAMTENNTTYRIHIVDASGFDNYQVLHTVNVPVQVTDARFYEDVPNVSYYTNDVYKLSAYALGNHHGIMNGYNGTKIFGPFNHLQRYQAAVVVFNIARHNANNHVLHDETHVLDYDKNQVVYTPFKDLQLRPSDTNAVAWAAANGIVTGYGKSYSKNNLFRPYQNVSRQEFAAMLQRYAKLLKDYKAGDSKATDKFPDASAIAGWAQTGVDWATSNGVITGLRGEIRPNDPIFRADTAVMVVRSGLASGIKE